MNDDADTPPLQRQVQPPNIFSGLTVGSVIIAGSLLGTGYVAHYRLGQIERAYDSHTQAGHIEHAVSNVHIQNDIRHLTEEFNRVRERVRVLEDDIPINFKRK